MGRGRSGSRKGRHCSKASKRALQQHMFTEATSCLLAYFCVLGRSVYLSTRDEGSAFLRRAHTYMHRQNQRRRPRLRPSSPPPLIHPPSQSDPALPHIFSCRTQCTESPRGRPPCAPGGPPETAFPRVCRGGRGSSAPCRTPAPGRRPPRLWLMHGVSVGWAQMVCMRHGVA